MRKLHDLHEGKPKTTERQETKLSSSSKGWEDNINMLINMLIFFKLIYHINPIPTVLFLGRNYQNNSNTSVEIKYINQLISKKRQ